MSDGSDCNMQMIDGVPTCSLHSEPLVERAVLESGGVIVHSPQVDGLFCPVSTRQFSRPAVADALWDDLEEG
jgi:hypothetical protein